MKRLLFECSAHYSPRNHERQRGPVQGVGVLDGNSGQHLSCGEKVLFRNTECCKAVQIPKSTLWRSESSPALLTPL
jgi:hypothetical protein